MFRLTKKANFLRVLLKDKTGQAIFEYSLILVLVSLVVFSIMKLIGSNIVAIFTTIVSSF